MSPRAGLLLAPWLLAASVSAEEPRLLAPGAAVERELKAGEVHRYAIELERGEYLHAVIEQRGADVKATVTAPDGSVALRADGPIAADNGPEHVALVAAAGGLHHLAVERSGRALPPSRYALSVEAVRWPTEADLGWERAARATHEGCQLMEGEKPQAPAAMARLGEARQLWAEVGDRRMQMWVDNHLGFLTGSHTDRLEEAGAFYERSVAAARETADDFGEAFVLVNLAENQRKRARLEEATASLERARALHAAAGRTFRETRVLLVLGAMANTSGDLQQALDLLREALRRYEEAQDPFGRGQARLNMGNSYLRLGEYELAIESYEQASRDLTGDRMSRAYLAGQIGVARHKLGDLARARAAYAESLAAYQAGGNRVREATQTIKLATLDRQEGRLQAAREALAGAAAVLGASGDPLVEALAWCELGETHRQLGEPGPARDAFARADALSPEWHVALKLCLEQGRARLARDVGDLAAAQSHAERALETVESLRASVDSQRARGAALASTQSAYELLVEVRMRRHAWEPAAGHDAAAFAVSERARARSLLELLAEGRLDVRQDGPPARRAEARALRRRLSALAQAQEDAASARRAQRAAALGREITAAAARLAEVEAERRGESGAYAGLSRPQPLGLDEIRARVLDADTVLLEYALGEGGGHLFVVSAEGLASHPLPAREVIERAARRLRDASSSPERAREWSAAARELGGLILPAGLERLRARRLLVVAPGALQYVPFAALPLPAATGRAGTLLQRFEVVTAPSASVLATLRQDRAGAPRPRKELAVFADPVFEAGDPRVRPAPALSPAALAAAPAVRGVPGQDTALTRLPFSRQEAKAILAGAPRRGSLLALGFDATRERALSAELADYRIVHFATHGVLNPRQPELSGMVLSLVDRAGRRQDGFLRLHDVYNLRLGAELVVLSGCQTGLGQDLRGEGLQGLTRGFMFAGAPRVVASLWQVDDLATAELMKRFYRGMFVRKLPPAAALQAAQRELAATRRWRDPFYWAAFVLHGDWR